MRSEPRPRAREDDEEEAITAALEEEGREDASLHEELDAAIARCDAAEVIALLDAEVIAHDGGGAARDGGLPPSALRRARSELSYRGASTLRLARALGPRRVAAVLADLLAAAVARGAVSDVRDVVERFAASGPVAEALPSEVLSRGAAVAAALEAMRPGSVRLSAAEIRAIAHGDARAVEAALPRLALGVPSLDGKTRKRAGRLVWMLADRHDPVSLAALEALLRAKVPTGRTLGGETPTERATKAGALGALRALERAGAKAPRRSPSRAVARRKSAAPRPAAPSSGPRKPWWQRSVRPAHVAMGVAAFAALALLHPTGAFLALVAFSLAFVAIIAATPRVRR